MISCCRNVTAVQERARCFGIDTSLSVHIIKKTMELLLCYFTLEVSRTGFGSIACLSDVLCSVLLLCTGQ